MLPEGWFEEKLGTIATVERGRFSIRPRNDPRYFDGAYPFVQTGDVTQSGIYLRNFSQTLNDAGLAVSKLFPANTILMTIAANIGEVTITTFPVACPDSLVGIVPHPKKANVVWLVNYLEMEKDGLDRNAPKLAQKNINLEVLKPLRIKTPPLPEQKKIADILSTWDAGIETTAKLLANAESQKRALMQQLLTGKRRLKGFEGSEWAKSNLSEVAAILVSNVDKKTVGSEQPVRLCNYTDVYKNDKINADMDFMVATATTLQISKFKLFAGDVIITKDSETPADIAIPSYVASTADDLLCGYHLAILRPGKKLDGRYLKYLLEHKPTRHYFLTRATGATRFGLTVGAIEEMPLKYPSKAEQIKIADCIEAVETQIGIHRVTIEGLRAEKRALMQQLLTGKRRVKL